MSTKTAFYSYRELFSLAWEKGASLLPTYLSFSLPLILINFAYSFLLWKFPVAKGDSSVWLRLVLEMVLAIFLGSSQFLLNIIIFRNGTKQKSFLQTYQEVWKRLAGFVVENFLFLFFFLGGFLFLLIPGVIFVVQFSFFGWIRTYYPDKKVTHFAESKALVRGNFWQVMWGFLVPRYIWIFW